MNDLHPNESHRLPPHMEVHVRKNVVMPEGPGKSEVHSPFNMEALLFACPVFRDLWRKRPFVFTVADGLPVAVVLEEFADAK